MAIALARHAHSFRCCWCDDGVLSLEAASQWPCRSSGARKTWRHMDVESVVLSSGARDGLVAEIYRLTACRLDDSLHARTPRVFARHEARGRQARLGRLHPSPFTLPLSNSNGQPVSPSPFRPPTCTFLGGTIVLADTV